MATADTVYRKQIRPVVMGCAQVVDSLFPAATAYADPCQCVSENWVCETMCFMQKFALCKDALIAARTPVSDRSRRLPKVSIHGWRVIGRQASAGSGGIQGFL